MSLRFSKRREQGNDWAIHDSRRGIDVASGLTEEEAQNGADNRNKELKENTSKSS